MEDFNITGQDKLLNYESYNPTFSVYQPLEMDKNVDYNSGVAMNDYSFGSGNIPVVTNDTDLLPAAKTPKKEPEKAKGIMDMFREMAEKNKTLAPNFSAPSIRSGIKAFSDSLAKVESNGGNYKAFNSAGGGQGAVGKYQFRWNPWKDSINKITGINNKEEFMNNPQAQEDFFDHYYKTTLIPQLQTVRKEFPGSRYTDDEIMKLLHFQGLGGIRTLLKKGDLNSKVQSFNLSPAEYLKQSR